METQNGRHDTRDIASESSNAVPQADAVPQTDQTADRIDGREPRVDRFHIIERTANGRRVIAACGELDLSTAAQLEERLAGQRDTVLDLSELSFIDSTGIHVVISTARRARSEAWGFTVRNPQPAVLRVMKLVGLTELLGLESHTEPEEDANQPPPLT